MILLDGIFQVLGRWFQALPCVMIRAARVPGADAWALFHHRPGTAPTCNHPAKQRYRRFPPGGSGQVFPFLVRSSS